jgi:hypothetical protein
LINVGENSPYGIGSTPALAFFAPIYSGWALDLAGNTNFGMYTAIVVIFMSLTCLTVFFFRYKARPKASEAR